MWGHVECLGRSQLCAEPQPVLSDCWCGVIGHEFVQVSSKQSTTSGGGGDGVVVVVSVAECQPVDSQRCIQCKCMYLAWL